jgi:hypothetical protein
MAGGIDIAAPGASQPVVAMTTADQLAVVNQAINAILSGAQEYQIGTRRLRRANLNDLFRERNRLEAKLADESGAGVSVAYFDVR